MGQSVVLLAALVGSLLAHLLALGLAYFNASWRTPARDGNNPQDRWVADSVEVGTVPDARSEPPTAAAPVPAVPPRPAAEPQPPREPEPASPPKPRAAFSPRSDVAPNTETTSPLDQRARRRTAPATDASPRGASSGTAASVASGEPANTEPAGSLGAVGLPVGVRHFGRAFARALPAANTANRAWSELPLGRVGAVAIRVEIDAEGHLANVEFEREPAAPSVLKAMVERAVVLLRSGTFSVDARAVRGGVERLTIEVTLSERAVSVHEGYNPAHFHGLGSEPPTPGRPGHARFTLNSGRHFEATVRFSDP